MCVMSGAKLSGEKLSGAKLSYNCFPYFLAMLVTLHFTTKIYNHEVCSYSVNNIPHHHHQVTKFDVKCGRKKGGEMCDQINTGCPADPGPLYSSTSFMEQMKF